MQSVATIPFRSVLFVALAAACFADSPEYRNPIMPGDWSDPGVIRVGTDYYTCRSSFGWQPGVPIAQSRDLIHWRYIGHAFTSLPDLRPADTRGGIWGVEMGFNPNTKQYLIYAPTREGKLFVFNSSRPEGPYEMHRMGHGLGIDPGFFADDDGRLYLVLNQGIIHELTSDGLSIRAGVCRVDRSRYRFFEGPDIFKHGGRYYLLYSDGGTLPHQPSTISTLRARRLQGPWEEDPGNPVMLSTDNGATFQGPAHGTLLDTGGDRWYLTYHAHEPQYYTLGREMLMEPVEWTADGWWRPVSGRVPTTRARAPELPPCDFVLAQSDEFSSPNLGLQWFFSCPPDTTGRVWSLSERPGYLRIRTAPGDLGSRTVLPAVFQQRVIDKAFAVEACLEFDAREGHEAAGLHLFHDPGMNLWLASTVDAGRRIIAVGKYNAGRRSDLWSVPNIIGRTVFLKISVDGDERASFWLSADGRRWSQVGGTIYFGASGGFLRGETRGDPDLGWVGRYKDPAAPRELAMARPGGNVWTGATFGMFAVRDGATESKAADFDHLHVTK